MAPLSAYLRWIHYLAFCRQHRLNPFKDSSSMASVDDELLRVYRRMNQDDPINDLSASRNQNPKWVNFVDTMRRCKIQGFTDGNLQAVLWAVRDLGEGRVAWSAEWRVDTKGGFLGLLET
ncbi:MAG: hypothetical protein Q9195_001372 [Heterodermia aff. obscurata]